MEYVLLSKIYYKDKTKYNELYQSRFNSENAVHFDFDIAGNPIFMIISHELNSLLANVLRIDKKISSVVLPGQAYNQFAQRCLIDEIIITNSIEGVHSTRREISSILEDIDTDDKKKRFRGLVDKYVKIASEDVALNTCEDIRTLYDEIVSPEIDKDKPDGAIFRKEMVSVLSETQKEIHKGVYPEAKICESMDKALRILHDTNVDALYRICVFHYLFGYIHPFYDGNGRMSRFITSHYLSKEIDSLIGYRISYTIKENLRLYYEAFKICNDPRNKGDITPFVITFMQIIEKSMVSLHEALQERQEKLQSYEKQILLLPNGIQEKLYGIYHLLIQASLFSEEGISKRDIMTISGISSSTLYQRLKTISESGLLLERNLHREKYYSLDLDKTDEYITNLSRSNLETKI